jgi:hypothetical protein
MNRKRKAAGKSQSRPGTTRGAAAEARARRAIASVERDASRRNKQAAKELERIQAEYRRELVRMVGAGGMRELDVLRSARSRLPRSRRIKRSVAVLEKIGVDKARILELRLPYLNRARKILDGITAVAPLDLPYHAPCDNPWVTYRAPFGGYSWAYAWERTSNPPNPVLERYLDTQTGLIGSRIEIEESSASDYDFVSAAYYTGLSAWHTPLSTGPLEVYLVFEFNTSTYSGEINDEFGFSDCLYAQGAYAELLAADAFDPVQRDTVKSSMYGFTEFSWAEDDFWLRQIAAPHDMHWYFFRTAATFQQGSSVLLEGGIRHSAWFQTNDKSVSMSADVNLRLDAIMVRSCEAEIIL